MSAPFPLDLRPELTSIAPYNAGLTLAQVAARPGVTAVAKLGSNENPYGTAPGVVAAVTRAAGRLHLYPDPSGRDLCAAIAAQAGCTPAQVILGDGSEDLLNVLARALLRPGDRVVTLFPSFPLHEDYALMMGARVQRIGLTDTGAIDVDALCAAVAQPARLIVFANPMNPAGVWLSPDALDRVLAAQHPQSLMCIDEAYVEYTTPDSFRSALTDLARHTKPLLILRTLSKAWGLAALRIGYGITNDTTLRRGLDLVRTPFNTNHLAQIAALAALADPDSMRQSATKIMAERTRVAQALLDMGIRVLPSQGNFLFFDTAQPSVAVAERLLDHGVIVKPWKQSGYETWIRVSIGLPAENAQFLAALTVAIQG
ncbi:MAG TPA: histidinol-phosphate transaminase [Paenirhodobacter sp.]